MLPTLRQNHKKEDFTENVEKKQRRYETKVGKTVFIVIAEESETAKETASQKIQRLVDNDCDRLIAEEKRRIADKNAIV